MHQSDGNRGWGEIIRKIWQKYSEMIKAYVKSLLFFILAGGVSTYFVHISMQRELDSFEYVIFQLLISGAGIAGSFIIGRHSAKESAKEMIRPHAMSAFRRVLNLYKSLSNLAYEIEESREANQENEELLSELDKFRVMVREQIATADVAMDDWKYIFEDIEEMKEIIEQFKNMEEK